MSMQYLTTLPLDYPELISALSKTVTDHQFYPNPTRDHLILSTKSISNYRVFNGLGQLVNAGYENQINVENLTHGIYSVIIEYPSGKITTGQFQKL